MRVAYNNQTGEYLVDRGQGWEPASQAEASAAQMSPLEAGLSSVGQTMRGMATGIARFTGLPYEPIEGEERALYEANEAINPVSHFAGSLAPHVLTGPIGVGRGLVGMGVNAMIGATMGAIDTEAGGTAGTRAAFGAGGAVAGDMVGRVLGRVGRYIRGRRSAGMPTDEMAERAMREGATLTEGMRTMDPELMAFEQYKQTGIAGTAFKEAIEGNQDLMNRKVANALGVAPSRGGKVTDNVLAAAESNLNRTYGDIFTDNVQITVDPDSYKGIVRKSMMDMLKQRKGQIRGKEIRQLRSELSYFSKSQDEMRALNAVDAIDELDNALAGEIAPQDVVRFEDARAKWQMMFALEKGNALNQAGDVNYTTFSKNMGRSFGRRGYQAPADIMGAHRLAGGLSAVTPPPNSYTQLRGTGAFKAIPRQMIPEGYVPATAELLKGSAGRSRYGAGLGQAAGIGLMPEQEILY